MDMIDRLKANAELVIKQFPDEALGYDERSVEWLDGFIERQRLRMEPEKSAGLAQTLGCFLGECICRNFGGEWQETEYGPAVVFSDGNACYPLNKTGKQFANGADDSVLSFYRTIPVIFGDQNIFGDDQNVD
jgi:hypothetical protein